MLKIKSSINQYYLAQLTAILSNLNNFHSLEVVDRVSETQLQVGENSDWIIRRLKGSRNAEFFWDDAELCVIILIVIAGSLSTQRLLFRADIDPQLINNLHRVCRDT